MQGTSEQPPTLPYCDIFLPARSMSKLGSLTPCLFNERLQSYNSHHFISSTPLLFYSDSTDPGEVKYGKVRRTSVFLDGNVVVWLSNFPG